MITVEEYIEKHRHTRDILKSRYAALPIPDIIARLAETYGFYSVPIECYTDEEHIIGVSLHTTRLPQEKPARQGKVIFHNHNYFELVYVYSGSCVNRFRHESLTLRARDLLLLNPSVMHDLYTEDADACIFNIMLDKDLFRRQMHPVSGETSPFTDFFMNYFYSLDSTQDFLMFPRMENHLIYDTLNAVIEEHINLQPGNKNIILSLLSLFFSLLAREYTLRYPDIAKDHKKLELITSMILYIRQHCTHVTLAQLEKQFSYSSGYLSRLIIRQTGKNFKELTTHFRLERIEDLLVHTDLPVSSLVEESGFNDLSYLNKVFKKKYGVTPAQYRTIHR